MFPKGIQIVSINHFPIWFLRLSKEPPNPFPKQTLPKLTLAPKMTIISHFYGKRKKF
jgi:hypothetical protein